MYYLTIKRRVYFSDKLYDVCDHTALDSKLSSLSVEALFFSFVLEIFIELRVAVIKRRAETSE